MSKLPTLVLAFAVIGIAIAWNPLALDNSVHYARSWLHDRWPIREGSHNPIDCACEVKTTPKNNMIICLIMP